MAEGYCEIHKTQMRRYEKDGREWYSHKLDDGTWCKGKPDRYAERHNEIMTALRFIYKKVAKIEALTTIKKTDEDISPDEIPNDL